MTCFGSSDVVTDESLPNSLSGYDGRNWGTKEKTLGLPVAMYSRNECVYTTGMKAAVKKKTNFVIFKIDFASQRIGVSNFIACLNVSFVTGTDELAY